MADEDDQEPSAAAGRARKQAAKKKKVARKASRDEPASASTSSAEVTGATVGDPAESDTATEIAVSDQRDLVTGSAGPGFQGEALAHEEVRELIRDLPPEVRNKFIPGALTVHYQTRDVRFPMDGESALRMMQVLAGTSADMDRIRLSSDARRGWLMIDRTDVIGAQWVPNELTVPRRATMDRENWSTRPADDARTGRVRLADAAPLG